MNRGWRKSLKNCLTLFLDDPKAVPEKFGTRILNCQNLSEPDAKKMMENKT